MAQFFSAGLVEADADLDRPQLADATVAHGLARGREKLFHGRSERCCEPVCQNNFLRLNRFPQCDGFRDVVSDGLLDVDVFASNRRLDGNERVRMIRTVMTTASMSGDAKTSW